MASVAINASLLPNADGTLDLGSAALSWDNVYSEEYRLEIGAAVGDKNSIIANPQFVNPVNYDFRFRNTSNARKINFKPFDYTKAGVYGSESWKEKARISVELELTFNEVIKKLSNKTNWGMHMLHTNPYYNADIQPLKCIFIKIG